MSGYYKKYLEKLSDLSYTKEECDLRLRDSTIDEDFNHVVNALNEIKALRKLLSDFGFSELLNKAESNLQKQKAKIIDYYESCFIDHEFMGDKPAFENPDAIVILGCHQEMLRIRVNAAIPYLKKFPHALAILSGGGFDAVQTESDFMFGLLSHEDLQNIVVQEKDSMDTLGNALFSKLNLKARNNLNRIQNVLIVTSKFHAARSLYYFSTIFNTHKTFNIAVAGVSTTTSSQRDTLSEHELLTEYQAKYSINIFEKDTKNPLDDQAILIAMFQNHKLYMNRYDIIRKYLKISENVEKL